MNRIISVPGKDVVIPIAQLNSWENYLVSLDSKSYASQIVSRLYNALAKRRKILRVRKLMSCIRVGVGESYPGERAL